MIGSPVLNPGPVWVSGWNWFRLVPESLNGVPGPYAHMHPSLCISGPVPELKSAQESWSILSGFAL